MLEINKVIPTREIEMFTLATKNDNFHDEGKQSYSKTIKC